MNNVDDSKRWDAIHSKIHQDDDPHSAYAEEKEKLFPRNSLICDLGGGTGNDVMYFLRQGHSVILMDISKYALDTAQKRATAEGFADRLVTNHIDFGLHTLPLKDSSVDVFYSRISLHYFGSRHTARIFSDVYRSLKPGGKAYITFKSDQDEIEMDRLRDNAVEYEPGVFIENGQLKSRFSLDQLNQICKNAGIQNAQIQIHKEVLGKHESGADQVLLQNEVIFSK